MTDTETQMLERGDIVQITRDDHHWRGTLIVVDEVKSFGCQGFATVPLPGSNNMSGQAYIRLDESDYEKVGRCALEMKT